MQCLIRCLVRELPDITPNERVEKALRQFGIFPSDSKPTEQQTLIQSMYGKRVEVVKGNHKYKLSSWMKLLIKLHNVEIVMGMSCPPTYDRMMISKYAIQGASIVSVLFYTFAVRMKRS